MTGSTPRLILMGTGPFAVPAFAALAAAGYEIVSVVTRPARRVRSRQGAPPTPVREFAANHHLPLYDPPDVNDPAAIARLGALSADLLVVCDFGQILRPETLAVARWGGINLHGSLLPAYRGAAPVQWAILSGDRITGVSVIHMTPRLDGGPIIGTAQTEIGDDETAGELEQRLALLGVAPTLAAVDRLASWDGVEPLGQPQDPATVSRAPRLSKSDGRIDWTQSATKIACHVRGMQPWPGAYSELRFAPDKPPHRIVVRRVHVLGADQQDSLAVPADVAESPGRLLSNTELVVATGDGRLQIDRLQVAGRSEMTGQQFLRGHRLAIGTRLGDEPSGGYGSDSS